MNFDINIFGWILLALNAIAVIFSPLLALTRKEWKLYDFMSWIFSVLGFILLLFALGVIAC